MAQHIHQCLSCQKYTLEQACPACSAVTIVPKPPKFSGGDKYARLRREVKQKEWREKGWY